MHKQAASEGPFCIGKYLKMMKKGKLQHLFFVLVALFFFSCTKEKGWLTTRDGQKFFGEITADTLEYVWSGRDMEKIIHGEGVLSVYKNQELLQEIKAHSYWGALDWDDVKEGENNQRYIGNTLEGAYEGFGVLTKGDEEVMIANFKNSVYQEQLIWSKKGKIYYKGGVKNGKFSGGGTLYHADGTIHKKGIWEENVLIKTEKTVELPSGV